MNVLKRRLMSLFFGRVLLINRSEFGDFLKERSHPMTTLTAVTTTMKVENRDNDRTTKNVCDKVNIKEPS